MIERLQLIATHLLRFRLLIVIFGALSVLVLFASLTQPDWLLGGDLTIPAILCFCWAVTLYSVSALFRTVPVKPSPGARRRSRASYQMRRAGLWLLVLLMFALTLSLLLLTYQLLRAW